MVYIGTNHAGEEAELAAGDALDYHGHAGGPVPGADGEAKDGAEDLDDAVAGDVKHGGGDDAIGLGEAVRVLEVGRYLGRLLGPGVLEGAVVRVGHGDGGGGTGWKQMAGALRI